MRTRYIVVVLALLTSLTGGAVVGVAQVPPTFEVTITHSNSLDIDAQNSVACSPDSGDTTAETSYYRVFDLPSFGIDGTFTVSSVNIGVESTRGGDHTVTVNLYTLDGAFMLANLTLIGSSEAPIPSGTALTPVTIPVEGVAPPGSTLVVEVFSPDLSGVGAFFIGSNPDGQTGPSYLSAVSCGFTEPSDLADLGSPDMHIVMQVTGRESSAAACTSTATTIAGLQDEVNALNTSTRTINVLTNNLDNIQAALDNGNNETARSRMATFISKVVNNSDRKESNPDGILLDEANSLICGAANVLQGITLP